MNRLKALRLSRSMFLKGSRPDSSVVQPMLCFFVVSWQALSLRSAFFDYVAPCVNLLYIAFRIAALWCFITPRLAPCVRKMLEVMTGNGPIIDYLLTFFALQGAAVYMTPRFTQEHRIFCVLSSTICLLLVVSNIGLYWLLFAPQLKISGQFYIADYSAGLLGILLSGLYQLRIGSKPGYFLWINVLIVMLLETVKRIACLQFTGDLSLTFWRVCCAITCTTEGIRASSDLTANQKFCLLFATSCLIFVYLCFLSQIRRRFVKINDGFSILNNVLKLPLNEDEKDRFNDFVAYMSYNDRLFYSMMWYFTVFHQQQRCDALEMLYSKGFADEVADDAPYSLRALKYYITGQYGGKTDWYVRNKADMTFSLNNSKKINGFVAKFDREYAYLESAGEDYYLRYYRIYKLLVQFYREYRCSLAFYYEQTRYIKNFKATNPSAKPYFSKDGAIFQSAPKQQQFCLSIYSIDRKSYFPSQIVQFIDDVDELYFDNNSPPEAMGKLYQNIALLLIGILVFVFTVCIGYREAKMFRSAARSFLDTPAAAFLDYRRAHIDDYTTAKAIKQLSNKLGAQPIISVQYNLFNSLAQYYPNQYLAFTYFNDQRHVEFLAENFYNHFIRKHIDLKQLMWQYQVANIRYNPMQPISALMCCLLIMIAIALTYSKTVTEFRDLLIDVKKTRIAVKMKGFLIPAYVVLISALTFISFAQHAAIMTERSYNLTNRLYSATLCANEMFQSIVRLHELEYALSSAPSQENQVALIMMSAEIRNYCKNRTTLCAHVYHDLWCYIYDIRGRIPKDRLISEWKAVLESDYFCMSTAQRHFGLQYTSSDVKVSSLLSTKWILDPQVHSIYQHAMNEMYETIKAEFSDLQQIVSYNYTPLVLSCLLFSTACIVLLIISIPFGGALKISYGCAVLILLVAQTTIMCIQNTSYPERSKQLTDNALQQYADFIKASYLADNLYPSEALAIAAVYLTDDACEDTFSRLQLCMVKLHVAKLDKNGLFESIFACECPESSISEAYQEYSSKRFASLTNTLYQLKKANEDYERHCAYVWLVYIITGWFVYWVSILALLYPLVSCRSFDKLSCSRIVLLISSSIVLVVIVVAVEVYGSASHAEIEQSSALAHYTYLRLLSPAYLVKMYAKIPSIRPKLYIYSAVLSKCIFSNDSTCGILGSVPQSLDNQEILQKLTSMVAVLQNLFEKIYAGEEIPSEYDVQLDEMASLYYNCTDYVIHYVGALAEVKTTVELLIGILAFMLSVLFVCIGEHSMMPYKFALPYKARVMPLAEYEAAFKIVKYF